MKRFLPILWMALVPAGAGAQPLLDATVPVLDERFDGALNRYDGHTGVWSTIGRTGRLMTNASEAVFLDYGVLGDMADAVLPPLHVITETGLSLRSAPLPSSLLPSLQDYMKATGQGARAADVLYGVGKITTAQTWSQTYGYFEIEARMPRGKGRWPAFWLTFAGAGWPPEIDVVEAYGAGLDKPTKKDNTYNTAVFFDALDADGEPTHATDIINPFAAADDTQLPKQKQRGGRSVFNFHHLIEADTEFGANIYDNFHVYAALWTPDTIHFYFGTTRDTLREVYRTPTPPDVHVPMHIIANDQFTARGAWWAPRPDAVDRILDPENDFRIRRIVVRALVPDLTINIGEGDVQPDDRSSVILDTPSDDVITPAKGFDLIRLTGGKDRIYLVRGHEQKIISGFGPDDVIDLDGYPFLDSADALSRLTQVGADVWLPSGADPTWPHTIVFRNATVADIQTEQFHVRWPVALNNSASADGPQKPQVDEDLDGVLTSAQVSAQASAQPGAQASAQAGAWLSDKGAPVHMTGTAGPDRYMVANKESTVDEPSGGGLDTLITWVDFELPANVERGIVRGRGGGLIGTATDDRLETETTGATLEGGRGDDLYVLHPGAKHTRILIDLGHGHDRIRGLKPDDKIVLTPALLATRDRWRFTTGPGALDVAFSDDQSVALENITQAEFLGLFSAD